MGAGLAANNQSQQTLQDWGKPEEEEKQRCGEMAVLQLSLSVECCNLVTDWAQSAYTDSLYNMRATAGKEADRCLAEEWRNTKPFTQFFQSFS